MILTNLPLSLSTLIVLLIPVLTYSLRSFFPQNMDKFNSVAGGLGIVSIIVAMIPGIVSTIPEILEKDQWKYLSTYPQVSYVLLLSVLFGFITMYTFAKLAYQKTAKGENPSNLLYFVNLLCLCVVLFSAVSALPAIARGGMVSLYLFTSILCFEIFLEENGLIRHYKERFHNGTRAIIVGSGVLGYVYGAYFIKYMPYLISSSIEGLITGFLLLAIVKTEFDLLEQRSHFPTFLLSALFKIILLYFIFFGF
jgi:hypothetical protein